MKSDVPDARTAWIRMWFGPMAVASTMAGIPFWWYPPLPPPSPPQEQDDTHEPYRRYP
ncbi:hypothetical protein GCM10009733_006370 [Nonomuraea maheshkhaliensis]|uniref:Uncharacterized protein n=1 Tax=Nonomuraea maheshkhaliensis TaxID=419590 RepID=A0ABP4QPZ8_9ACTN